MFDKTLYYEIDSEGEFYETIIKKLIEKGFSVSHNMRIAYYRYISVHFGKRIVGGTEWSNSMYCVTKISIDELYDYLEEK